MASRTWASTVPSQSRKPAVSWAVSKEVWPAGQGRWSYSSTVCWWDLTWSTVSWCGDLSRREVWTCWSMSRGGPQRWSTEQSTSTHAGIEMQSTAGAVQPGEEKAAKWPDSGLSDLKGSYRKERDRIFRKDCGDRPRGNNFKLKESFRLVIKKKKSYTVRALRYWNRFAQWCGWCHIPRDFQGKTGSSLGQPDLAVVSLFIEGNWTR